MADFEQAVEKTLKAEGGFFHNLKTGEVVNRGITLATIRSLGILKSHGPATQADIEFIQSLTEEETKDIYHLEYWSKLNLDDIHFQDVANKIFDLAVNMGVVSAARMLQKACNVTPDGIVGPITIGRANAIDPVVLLATIRSEAADRYEQIAQANPVLASNLPGWLGRLNT